MTTKTNADVLTNWVMLPFDYVRWLGAVWNRQPPKWNTPNVVTLESPFALLRDFSRGNPDVVPTLIFPPMAGHSSHIIDAKGQSQIQLIIDNGLTRVFCFEWLSATKATKNVTIEDRMLFIDRAVTHILVKTGASKVNIVGNCQGGWESAIWAALHPELVNTFIIAGAPIDTSVDINPDLLPLIKSFKAMGPGAVKFTLDAMIAMEGGVHRGLSQISMFVMFHPFAHQMAAYRLLWHMREPGEVERFTQFYDWYFWPVDMSGAMFKWCLPHIFIDNELYRGELVIAGEKVDLHNITCPVFILAGEADDITPPAQMMNMANVLGSERVEKYMTPGGHLGVFIGHRSQTTVWPEMLAKVRELSTAKEGTMFVSINDILPEVEHVTARFGRGGSVEVLRDGAWVEIDLAEARGLLAGQPGNVELRSAVEAAASVAWIVEDGNF